MKRAIALAGMSALALTGVADASTFDINIFAMFNPEHIPATISPSSGSFMTQYAEPGGENAFLQGSDTGGQAIVVNDAYTWNHDADAVMASTWLSIDRYGPGGPDGTAPYGTGWYLTKPTTPPGSTVQVPEGTQSIGAPGLAANGQNGDPVNGDGLSPGFVTGEGGLAWSRALGQSSPSGHTVINGERISSIFIGHFVLTDPNATLVGDDLLAWFWPYTSDPEADQRYFLPLDGMPVTLVPNRTYWLEYERVTFTNSLGTFTAIDMYLVPAPGAAALLGALTCAGFLTRRRPIA